MLEMPLSLVQGHVKDGFLLSHTINFTPHHLLYSNKYRPSSIIAVFLMTNRLCKSIPISRHTTNLTVILKSSCETTIYFLKIPPPYYVHDIFHRSFSCRNETLLFFSCFFAIHSRIYSKYEQNKSQKSLERHQEKKYPAKEINSFSSC